MWILCPSAVKAALPLHFLIQVVLKKKTGLCIQWACSLFYQADVKLVVDSRLNLLRCSDCGVVLDGDGQACTVSAEKRGILNLKWRLCKCKQSKINFTAAQLVWELYDVFAPCKFGLIRTAIGHLSWLRSRNVCVGDFAEFFLTWLSHALQLNQVIQCSVLIENVSLCSTDSLIYLCIYTRFLRAYENT